MKEPRSEPQSEEPHGKEEGATIGGDETPPRRGRREGPNGAKGIRGRGGGGGGTGTGGKTKKEEEQEMAAGAKERSRGRRRRRRVEAYVRTQERRTRGETRGWGRVPLLLSMGNAGASAHEPNE